MISNRVNALNIESWCLIFILNINSVTNRSYSFKPFQCCKSSQFFTKVSHMHINKIGIGMNLKYVAPQMFCELQSGYHTVFMEHQIAKNIKFFFGQCYQIFAMTYFIIL